MALRDVWERMYRRQSRGGEKQRGDSKYDPSIAPGVFSSPDESISDEYAVDTKAEKYRAVRRGIFFVIGTVSVIAFVVAAVYWNRTFFSFARVEVSVSGPDAIASNEEGIFTIHISNRNRADLKDAEVELNFPQSFLPGEESSIERRGLQAGSITLGTIRGGEKKDVEIHGRFFGSKDEAQYLRAALVYTPENVSGRFRADGQKTVALSSSALLLDISAPIEAASGDEIVYRISYENLTNDNFYAVRLQVEYPGGFSFLSSDPSPSEGENIWYLGTIGGRQSGSVTIHGIMEGNKGDTVTIRTVAGYVGGEGVFIPYSEGEYSTKIVSSPLSLQMEANGAAKKSVIHAGDTLRYTLKYANEGDIRLRAGVVTLHLIGSVFDIARIKQIDRGYLDTATQTITWRASDISALGEILPGESGVIEVDVPLLESLPVSSANDKNFTAKAVATIDSPDVPDRIGSRRILGTDAIRHSVSSRLVVSQNSAASLDTVTVGNAIEYEVRLAVSNLYSTVKNIHLIADLPSPVEWMGADGEERDRVSYDERTHRMVWDIGSLDAGVGILSSQRELVFRISVLPQENQIDNNIILFQNAEISGEDTFTGETLRTTVNDIKTTRVQASP